MSSPAAAAIDPEAIRLRWREGCAGNPSAITMNFIVYVENEAYREWVCERAQRIADKHPCRMIVLDAVPGRHGSLVATGDRPGERVDIGVDGVRAAERAHYVEALLVRDVPIVLWWAADRLFASNTFQALIGRMEHVILDSSGTGTDPRAIREFAAFFTGEHDVALRDLAWMRLDPWRDVVAQFFDDPAARSELSAIRRIAVSSGSDAEALYLGAWLASRLGWKVCDVSTFCDAAGKNIPFERKREGEIRRVQRILIETDSSAYSAYVSGEGAVGVEVSGTFARSTRHVPLQAIDNASLVERAILSTTPDTVFIEALRTVGELLKDMP